MAISLPNLATDRNRWYALVFIAMGLAIVIIDNTVLNVSIPYMLRDLNTTLPSIEWAISGYALTIATTLITVGRLGDMWGRKKIFLAGIVIFAAGSLISSEATSAAILIFGRGIVQALGAAMALTSALSLLTSEFKGSERAIAFGIWGAIAGASASIGPLLGGYLTTYYSWRWSLRINVVVGLITILGSVFIKESKGEQAKRFDWWGMVLSGTGLFSLVFAIIEGQKYGWFSPNKIFSIGGWTWPLSSISIIPFFFAASAILLGTFGTIEYRMEKRGGTPLLKLSLFRNTSFSIGLAMLAVLAFGQLGTFFIMPIYLENVLGFDALKAGIVFLSSSITVLIVGPLSGFIASRVGPRILVILGMIFLPLGTFLISLSISTDATGLTLAPALIVLGLGIGLGSAQLSNTILSAAPLEDAGEASAATTTIRQVGSSIGIAIVGTILTSSLMTNIADTLKADPVLPEPVKLQALQTVNASQIESGQSEGLGSIINPKMASQVKGDLDKAFVKSSKETIRFSIVFILIGTVLSFFLPKSGTETNKGYTFDTSNKYSNNMSKRDILIIAIIMIVGLAIVFYQCQRAKNAVPPSSTPETQTVMLYYYNEEEDKELSGGEIGCSPEAVLPVSRTIESDNAIEDTIKLLISGDLTEEEKQEGFSTEFPHQGFSLVSSNLADGILTLTFTEVPGFTTGGSCRVSILSTEIIKTAEQFPQVDEVILQPDFLFQP
jgi:EmrB/QacA subfamily drug resistance transporter